MSTMQYLYTQRKDNDNTITLAPALADLDVVSNLDLLKNDTTLRQALPSDTISDGELQAAIDYRNAFKQGDVITALCNFYSSINGTYFKQADFSLENILFWYQKLFYSNKEITSYRSQASYYSQNILTNQLPGAALFAQNASNNASFNHNTYFDNISDSIGTIANSKYIQLDQTLPIFDVGQQYYGVPIPYAASMENKISANTRNVMFDLSHKTTLYMRRNLLGVAYTNLINQQNMKADASTSHGLNLINDLPTFITINAALDNFKNAISSVFNEAKIFGFVQYLNNIANESGFNLRDIFPRSPGDKDFTVVTSAENAQAAEQIANQEAQDAIAEKAVYTQQEGMIDLSTGSSLNGNLLSITSSGTTPPSSVYLGPDADPEAVKKQLGLKTTDDAKNAIIAYNTAYNEALKRGVSSDQAQQVAAAICGNIAQESSFNTNLIHDGGIGYGLLGENQDILARMQAYAVSKGESPTNVSAQTQIEALFKEPAFYSRGGFSSMANASDVSSAAQDFAVKYLKPVAATANYQARQNNAISIQNSFTPTTVTVNTSSPPQPGA